MERTFFEWIVYLLQIYWAQFLKGTGTTVLLAVVGTFFGFLIGLVVGVVRTLPLRRGGETGLTLRLVVLRVVNALLAIYIEVFRGTPMMVQAMLLFYGIPQLTGFQFNSLPAAMLVIVLNTGAYMAEIVRGGIQSVDSGQTEAGKAIGMTHWQIMANVVLPQTIRNILPATGNEFIVNLKDSSVLSIIMVYELFYAANDVRAIFYRPFEPYVIAAVIYLILTFVSSRLLRFLESKMDGPQNFTLIASSTTPHMLNKKK